MSIDVTKLCVGQLTLEELQQMLPVLQKAFETQETQLLALQAQSQIPSETEIIIREKVYGTDTAIPYVLDESVCGFNGGLYFIEDPQERSGVDSVTKSISSPEVFDKQCVSNQDVLDRLLCPSFQEGTSQRSGSNGGVYITKDPQESFGVDVTKSISNPEVFDNQCFSNQDVFDRLFSPLRQVRTNQEASNGRKGNAQSRVSLQSHLTLSRVEEVGMEFPSHPCQCLDNSSPVFPVVASEVSERVLIFNARIPDNRSEGPVATKIVLPTAGGQDFSSPGGVGSISWLPKQQQEGDWQGGQVPSRSQ
jgi:hypothetical protein